MNLTKLFDTQRILDERIVRQKGLEGRDVLPEKILALLVELGELANEERSWKFWSEDREPRIFQEDASGTFRCECEDGYLSYGSNGLYTCDKCDGCGAYNNPLLEEYVDCLHFILSIGLDGGIVTPMLFKPQEHERPSITLQFSVLFESIARVGAGFHHGKPQNIYYEEMFSEFIYLGEMLGFTREQIEAAYFEKNAINHSRQDNGY